MSFSGRSRPFFFRYCLSLPYSRATSISDETMALPDANRSTLAVFSDGRADFAAPKNNSPSATAGMNTSAARSRLESTPSSPSRRAMMMLVSSRNLPFAGVNALALLFDRLGHLPSRHGINRRCELSEVCALLARRRPGSEGSHEPEHLLLRLRRQFFDLPGNLLSDVHLPVPYTLSRAGDRCRTARSPEIPGLSAHAHHL